MANTNNIAYIEREIKQKFEKLYPIYTLIALVGPRQAGKTTFLKNQLKGTNDIYISLDNPDGKDLFDSDIQKFENQYIKYHKIIVIDEVHYGKDAGIKLKYITDNNADKKIWLTSSSQLILSIDVLSWLVGRVSILYIYPFSLSELLLSKNQKEVTPTILARYVSEHIVYGGYPKVVLTEDLELKKIILMGIYETMVLKDVAKTFSIEDISSLEKFCKYLSNSIGNVMIYENISREIGLSFQTIKKYLDAMEKSYLIIQIYPFYKNKLTEIIKQPKIYFIDNGIRNAIANNFPISFENDGKLFENYVLTELLKIGLKVRYWLTKSKAEVDFIIEKNNKIIPIEVKLKSPAPKVDISLRSFIDKYKPKNAFIVYCYGEPQEIEVNRCKIKFIDIFELTKLLKKGESELPEAASTSEH